MPTAISSRNTIVEQLREDHERLRSLFSQFEQGDERRKREIATECIELITIHDQVEKKILYPYAEELPRTRDVVLRAKEAHHVVNILLFELNAMPFGSRFNAKFHTLIDGVR